MGRILKWIEGELHIGEDDVVETGLDFLTGEFAEAPATKESFLKHLPLQKWGFSNCPAIPYWADKNGDPDLKHVVATVIELGARGDVEAKPAYDGLSTKYTIDDQTLTAYEFLYGDPSGRKSAGGASATSPPPTKLALDNPEDFQLSWTTYQDVLKDSQGLVKPFAETLTHKEAATRSFWPTIATFGLPYNLLVLEKVDAEWATTNKARLGGAWAGEDMAALQKDGLLYAIDMRILASLEPFTALDGTVRFTPGTLTLLKQDPETRTLTPIAIELSTHDGTTRLYTGGDNAWLYALQAAKTSITVWGIWLGHVYHWHIPTAAMQMTMYDQLPAKHRLYELLQPQSQSLVDFDFVLLSFLWGQIAPPTPVGGYMELLALLDTFAEGRRFFDDDPLAELKSRGLDVDDFTVVTQWDAYPVVKSLLDIWEITGDYVSAVVDDLYASDDEVAQDKGLQAWMKASSHPDHGNVQGLPLPVKTRAELAAVLTSILYRVTVHGAGSLQPAVSPVLSFVANFPPSLQRSDMPEPDADVSTTELLDHLPHTGTIGGMTTFYFTFAYTHPYETLIPSGGVESDLYFTNQSCNDALVTYRTRIKAFVDEYLQEWNQAIARIRGGAAGPLPHYAQDQYGQWPRSIEI